MQITNTKTRALTAAMALFGSSIGSVNAAISITNFNLSETAVTFDISGTFLSTPPPGMLSCLFFANPNIAADPGFTVSNNLTATSASFSGTQALRGFSPSATGAAVTNYGDYFLVAFANDFATDEAINGSFSATWGSTTFTPSAVGSLDVYWGGDTSLADLQVIESGSLLTTIAVPEPTSALLLGLGSLCLVFRRSR